MPKYNLVADISAFQPHSLEFFEKLKRNGVKAVIIKLTQGSVNGDCYTNPKFEYQKRNAERASLKVHAYHYARFTSQRDAINEADWFLTNLEHHHVNKKSAVVLDAEDACLPKLKLDACIKHFLGYLENSGYRKTDLYAMAAWLWTKRIQQRHFKRNNLWIARYGNNQPGVDNVGTWQFTNRFHGMNLDMSYDFKNFYSK